MAFPGAVASFSPSFAVSSRASPINKRWVQLRGGDGDESESTPLPDEKAGLPPDEQPHLSASSPLPPKAAAAMSAPPAATPPVPPPEVVAPPAATTAPVVESKLGPKAPPPGPVRKAFPQVPWHLVPDALTYARCLAIPLLMWLFYVPGQHVATSLLFAFASFTDWLDGFLARRWDITSAFGAFLDPVADKIMVGTALILLSGRYGGEVAIPTAVILAREIAVSALREWMATRGERDSVQVGFQGKVKTALTMAALTLCLLVPADKSGALGRMYEPALLLLYASAAVTLTSGSVYFRAAAPALLGTRT